jgi:hypothetical protein
MKTAYDSAVEKIRAAAKSGQQRLSLSGMNLSDVPENLVQLADIKDLDLSSNRL